MAVLFLDDGMKRLCPDQYDLVSKFLEETKIIEIENLDLGIRRIVFDYPKFELYEPVIARVLQNGEISIRTRIDMRGHTDLQQ